MELEKSKDTNQQETPQNDTNQKDVTQKQETQNEVPPNETTQNETAQKEETKEDTARNETSQNNTARNEEKKDEKPKEQKIQENGEEDEEEEEEEPSEHVDPLQDLETEIEEMTKKVEHEKISLRTYKERYEKAFNHYCELKGLPVPQTKEQQQKEREKHLKQIKRHKVSDPIIHKKTKLGASLEIEDQKRRKLKLNINTVQSIQDDINVISLDNEALKEQILNLRKDKTTAIQLRQKIEANNEELQEKIDTQKEKNENFAKEIQYEEYKNAVSEGKEEGKQFTNKRDKMEEEYHKIIEESIKRERMDKKEKAKKRQLNTMVSNNKGGFKGSNAVELENYAKALKNEEISDRTPILNELLNKWKLINQAKADMVDKYTKNSAGIRKIFDEILLFSSLQDKILFLEEYQVLLLILYLVKEHQLH